MFQLEGYAQHYFRTIKKGIFKRTIPVRELLVWTKVTVWTSTVLLALSLCILFVRTS